MEAGETIGAQPLPASESAVGRGKEDNVDITFVRMSPKAGELGVAWTVAYYLLLFVGAYGFTKELWTLTESSNALASFRQE